MPEPHRSPRRNPDRTALPLRDRLLRFGPALVIALVAAATPLLAQAGPTDDELRRGADAYRSVCSACHQPGGAGLSGQYPPLVDNPNVEDAAYVESVIRNGREGVIVVNGETYDGVMPAQATVSDEDVAAIIAYIQSGFAAPAAPEPEVATGPAAGTELPEIVDMAILVAMLIALGAGAFVLAPRLVSAYPDRRYIPWLDASLKTAVIVIGMILATTVIPARVLEYEAVQDLPRAGQDLITVGLWVLGLGGGLLALWFAHREKRI